MYNISDYVVVSVLSHIEKMFIPPPALSQKNKQASDWLGVLRRLVPKTFIGCGDTTFLARYSHRRGGARASIARARPSLPRATASRKNKRKERSRDRENAIKHKTALEPPDSRDLKYSHFRARRI